MLTIGLDKQFFFQRKIVNIFLPIIFSTCFARSKELLRLIETVVLSTHIKCCGLETRKIIFLLHTLTNVLVLTHTNSTEPASR